MADGRSWYNYFTCSKGELLDWTPCKADRKGQTDRRGGTPGGRMLPILRRFPTGLCVRRLEMRSLRSSGIIVDRGRAPDGDSTVQPDKEVNEQGRHDAHPRQPATSRKAANTMRNPTQPARNAKRCRVHRAGSPDVRRIRSMTPTRRPAPSRTVTIG